eukprot:TRINITY_DN6570_c0_g1_i1.p1 TRINITY_DN6570_c0_g1~~TRINITY_DN6570_c0_g1_i1.p1  ORF type:complete len:201 (+),score=29.63 TRINITY_DN6570_c0_g1_i1:70-672(+)
MSQRLRVYTEHENAWKENHTNGALVCRQRKELNVEGTMYANHQECWSMGFNLCYCLIVHNNVTGNGVMFHKSPETIENKVVQTEGVTFTDTQQRVNYLMEHQIKPLVTTPGAHLASYGEFDDLEVYIFSGQDQGGLANNGRNNYPQTVAPNKFKPAQWHDMRVAYGGPHCTHIRKHAAHGGAPVELSLFSVNNPAGRTPV